MQYQEHFGRKFYLDKKTGYWISTDYPRIRAHVWVWTKNYGPIPEKQHVHHIDHNKSNNEINNLECLSCKDHVAKHMTPERIKKSSEWLKIVSTLSKEWHASDEGKKWHSHHAKNTFKRENPISNKCKNCGKEFFVDSLNLKISKFCSNACKSSYRRKTGKDDVEVVCERCKITVLRNKYAKIRFCSRGCKNKVGKKT